MSNYYSNGSDEFVISQYEYWATQTTSMLWFDNARSELLKRGILAPESQIPGASLKYSGKWEGFVYEPYYHTLEDIKNYAK